MSNSPSPAPSTASDITVPHMVPSEVIMHQAMLSDDSLATALSMISAIKLEADRNRMKKHAVPLIHNIIDTCGLGDHVACTILSK